MFFLLCFCFLWLTSYTASGAFVNVTVDDAGSDPVSGNRIAYNPSNLWNQGNDCPGCSTKLDPSQTFAGTWKDGTYNPIGPPGGSNPSGPLSITFTFTGTAIYAYCALASPTKMTFFIDGQLISQFADDTDRRDPSYRVPVFAHSGLPSRQHTFTLMNGATDGSGKQSLVLFDYLVYTRDDGQQAAPIAAAPVQSQQQSVVTNNSPQPSLSPDPTPTGQLQSTSDSSTGSSGPTSTNLLRPTTKIGASTPTATSTSNSTNSANSGVILNTVLETSGSVTVTLVQTISNSHVAGLSSQTALTTPVTPDNEHETRNKMSTAAIVGIAVGLAILALSVGIGILVWRRRRQIKQPNSTSPDSVQPFNASTDRLTPPPVMYLEGPSEKGRNIGAMGPSSHASSRTSLTISSAPSSSPRGPRQRDTDAGPLSVGAPADDSDTDSMLPPDYEQVFSPSIDAGANTANRHQ